MILSKKLITKAHAGLRLCCSQTPTTEFLAPRPNYWFTNFNEMAPLCEVDVALLLLEKNSMCAYRRIALIMSKMFGLV